MKRKIFSILMSVVLCLAVLPLGMLAQAVDNYSPFKGSGTASDPYQISSDYHLRLLSELIADTDTESATQYASASYIQTKDIDLKNERFVPIGNYPGVGFYGTYNGNYKTITNLMVEESRRYVGLFGWIQGGTVKNLTIQGEINVIEAENYPAVGGLAGEICDNAKIENCAFLGAITAGDIVGGLVGQLMRGGSIVGCYSNVNITASNKVAGIVGVTTDSNKESVIVVKNCYSVGKLLANGENTSGIIGLTYQGSETTTYDIINNYYLDTMSETGTSDDITGCIALTSDEMKTCADMLGSPFVNNMDETVNDGYPVFEWQSTPYQFTGSGTAEDPYQISSKEELETMRDLVNSTYFNPTYGHAYYKQTADIDLQFEPWIPIGLGYDGNDGLGAYNCTTRMFFGSYDGNRHSIHNLNVNQQWNDSGLFAFIRGKSAVVCNLAVDGSVSNAANCAGGIVGQPQYGAVIKNCAFIGDVSGEDYVGGISGYAWSGTSIINCYHNGNVSSEGRSGGIVGSIKFGSANSNGDYSIVENCYHANGTVTGTVCSGGIAGECVYYNGINTTIDIKNCYFSAGTAATTTCENATSDNTLALPENLMKKLAEDLGSVYADNPNETFNNGYPVFAWQLATYGQGDINFDGKVSVADAVLLQGYLLCRFSFNETEYYAADLIEDRSVNVFDMVVMKRILVKQ